jgi:alpha/beta hydrolase family protein
MWGGTGTWWRRSCASGGMKLSRPTSRATTTPPASVRTPTPWSMPSVIAATWSSLVSRTAVSPHRWWPIVFRSARFALVAGMIPAPGETPADWWDTTGYRQAMQEEARRDDGKTGSEDPFVVFYHDVPRALAKEALSKERSESDTAYHNPWLLDAWPAVATRFVLCTEDRFFPPDFMRRVVSERLGITPDEIAAGHCVALRRPRELADMLVVFATRR